MYYHYEDVDNISSYGALSFFFIQLSRNDILKD